MQKYIRLLISTAIGSFIMLSLSYCWHGIVLNDINGLSYDITIFAGLFIILYTFISFFLSFIISIYIPENGKLFKHFTIGLFFGFLIYLIAFVLGVSFSEGGLNHIVLDFVWQMIEQSVGAAVISLYYSICYRTDKIKKMEAIR